MAKIKWDEAGKHTYETGVSKGVLYPATGNGTYGAGVAWNGLTGVNEAADGGEVSAVYADNIKYLNLLSNEEFKATIEAYTYPDEFAECDGSAELVEGSGVVATQQKRKNFALSYQTKVGDDLDPEKGYKIHIVYGCLASPSDRSYETVNDSPEAMTFSWEITTTPVEVPNLKPTAHIIIDSTKVEPAKLKAIEDKLYGTESEEPAVITPEELITMLNAA